MSPSQQKHSTLAKKCLLLWGLALFGCLIYLALRISSGLAFDSSFLALLPAKEGSPAVEKANTRLQQAFSSRILLLIGRQNKAGETPPINQDNINQAGRIFSTSLRKIPELKFVNAQTLGLAQLEQQSFYLPYRYRLLGSEALQRLSNVHDSGAGFRAESLTRLFSPLAPPRAAELKDDPYGLHQQWLQEKTFKPGAIKFDEQGLYISDTDAYYRVEIVESQIGSFDLAGQERLLSAIELAFEEAAVAVSGSSQLSASVPSLDLLRSGMIFHTAAAAKQARKEITTIGVGSLIGVLLLLLLSFRSASPLLLSLTALAVGVMCALSVSLMVFGRLHMLTLAFGASLVGVSIDYAFHYFCSQQERESDQLKYILPALSLGLASSVLVYGIQALLPFPGLQQMALFSATGLIAAWATVVCVFPFVRPKKTLAMGHLYTHLSQLRISSASKGIIYTVMLAMLLLSLPKLSFEDDVRLLNNSPDELLKQESQIRSLSEQQGSSQYFLISADNWQEVLEQEEALRLGLDQLQSSGALVSYQALSQSLPSLRTQQQHLSLLKATAYSEEWLQAYFLSLGAPEASWREVYQRFNAATNNTLSWEAWNRSNNAKAAEQLWFETEGSRSSTKHSLVLLNGVNDAAALKQLKQDNVVFVDRVGDVSSLMARYRSHLIYALGLSYVVLALMLSLRFKRQAVRIVAVPLIATVAVYAGLSLSGVALNLFNILAALLILGIAMDMGIILQESRYQPHAWKAITLSALTTMLAFGLLALSKTPVLFSFGITLLPGIALAWLLSLLFAPKQII